MTKEQILSSLKPLEWNKYEFFDLYADGLLNYKYLIDVIYSNWRPMFFRLRWEDDILFKELGTLEEAKAAAQDHYNNLVLELFNLEVRK